MTLHSRPTTALVCRHPGGLSWLANQLHGPPSLVLDHLDPSQWKAQLSVKGRPVDRVLGVMPLHWSMRLEAEGIACWLMQIDLASHVRGIELTFQQIQDLGAHLYRYRICMVESWTPPQRPHRLRTDSTCRQRTESGN